MRWDDIQALAGAWQGRWPSPLQSDADAWLTVAHSRELLLRTLGRMCSSSSPQVRLACMWWHVQGGLQVQAKRRLAGYVSSSITQSSMHAGKLITQTGKQEKGQEIQQACKEISQPANRQARGLIRSEGCGRMLECLRAARTDWPACSQTMSACCLRIPCTIDLQGKVISTAQGQPCWCLLVFRTLSAATTACQGS